MFTGFTDQTVDFLWQIRFNNQRPWFEAHKEVYLKEVLQPMRELGEALSISRSGANHRIQRLLEMAKTE